MTAFAESGGAERKSGLLLSQTMLHSDEIANGRASILQICTEESSIGPGIRLKLRVR